MIYDSVRFLCEALDSLAMLEGFQLDDRLGCQNTRARWSVGRKLVNHMKKVLEDIQISSYHVIQESVFIQSPLMEYTGLTGWVRVDAAGSRTGVVLNLLEKKASYFQ